MSNPSSELLLSRSATRAIYTRLLSPRMSISILKQIHNTEQDIKRQQTPQFFQTRQPQQQTNQESL